MTPSFLAPPDAVVKPDEEPATGPADVLPVEDAEPEPAPPVPVLLEPREGTPDVLTTQAQLNATIAAFAAGTGPVLADAERASGYRYSQRAYLVQLRREGAGTVLIDPIALPDLSGLDAVLRDAEWVFHAASQDLPCLAEIGLHPQHLFDTELAGRLLGHDRVGLAAMTEHVLGVGLVKGHSAADWSTRPLPRDWLVYAALDVELLAELRDALSAELAEQGKTELAAQEFAAVLTAPGPAPRVEPWRRLSGIHKLRNRRQLAVARALWEARDARARDRDVAPGRVLPDSALMAAVVAAPADASALTALPVFAGPRMRRTAPLWLQAIRAGQAVPDSELPTVSPAADGPPPAARWGDRDPVAAARLARVRTALGSIAETMRMPVENILEPALSRRLAWAPPAELTADAVTTALSAGRARPWQIELTAGPLAEALAVPPEPIQPT